MDEQYICNKFHFTTQNTASEIHEMLKTTFGDKTAIQTWEGSGWRL